MCNKCPYGILPDGTKEILGIWIEQTEGAKFWLRVMNELKNRGAQDILIAVVDGLKGFPEVINAVFPQTVIQTCIVHLIRHSMDFAAWKDRKNVAQALRAVYRAADAKIGQAPSMPSHKVRGARSIRRSRRAGAATGTWPFRSSRSPKASAKLSTQRMRSTSLFCCAICYSVGARVIAWQRAGPEDVSPAAQPLPSLLVGGTRAPLTRTTRLPSADKLFVGMFSMARDIDLPIAQFLDIVGIGRATLVALFRRLSSL